jgi:hypothetical protein
VHEPNDPLDQPHCQAATLLPPKLQSEVLRAHPTVDLRLLGVYLTCAFDPHDEGDHHAVLYDHFPSPDAGALWTTWPTGRLPETFALHPDCPATSTRGTACGHFLDHPGAHSFAAEEERDSARGL